jgi:ABC-2 type transport system permease protein
MVRQGYLCDRIAIIDKARVVALDLLILGAGSLFFAGVWTPGDLMPESIRWLRDVTPMGAGMSSLQDSWSGGWPDGVHVIAMLAVTAVSVGVAARFFRWE